MNEYINRVSLIDNLNTFALERYDSLVNDLILKEPAADVVERTLFDERMAEYQESLDKANEKLAYITGTDDYHYDLEYGREQLNSYVSALVYEKTQEREKGKWVKVFSHGWAAGWRCSECSEYSPCHYDFCPNCGAKMREES